MRWDCDLSLHLSRFTYKADINVSYIDWLFFSLTVESLQWVRPDAMLVVYIQTNEDGEEEECPLILVTSSEGDIAKVKFALGLSFQQSIRVLLLTPV